MLLLQVVAMTEPLLYRPRRRRDLTFLAHLALQVTSGAQRIHDSAMLLARGEELGVDLTPIKDYVDSFRYGAFPHAGGGVGTYSILKRHALQLPLHPPASRGQPANEFTSSISPIEQWSSHALSHLANEL